MLNYNWKFTRSELALIIVDEAALIDDDIINQLISITFRFIK